LDSLKSVEVRCEVEGKEGVKLVSIVPEGVHVSAGQEVARYDTDAIQRSFAEQEIKFKTADGKSRAAKAELEVQENKQKSEIAKARSEWEAAFETAKLEQKQLERFKSQLDRYVVKAPQDGILVYFKRYYDDSSRIQPGALLYFSQPIFTLPDLTQMKVKVKVHESVVKKVTPGLAATIQVEALPNKVLHGTVKTVGTLAQSEGWRSSVKEYLTE